MSHDRNKCATRAENRAQTEDGGWYRYEMIQTKVWGFFCLFLIIPALASWVSPTAFYEGFRIVNCCALACVVLLF